MADSNGVLPSDGGSGADGYFREGIDPYSRFMPLAEAAQVIEEYLRDYRADIGPDGSETKV